MITFMVDDVQEERIKYWQDNHECPFREANTGKRRRGTAGDIDSFTFVPTALGTVTVVRCGCGAEIDVTYPL